MDSDVRTIHEIQTVIDIHHIVIVVFFFITVFINNNNSH